MCKGNRKADSVSTYRCVKAGGMQGLRYHVPMIREKEKSKIRQRAPEMFDYMMELFQGIDERYFLELSEDEELACSLFDHLECMV